MHHNHVSPALVRGRLRRAIDPCRIQRAELRRDGASLATVEVYRYRKRSFSAGLAMALSGVVSAEGALDKATVLSALPEGVTVQPDDELAFLGAPDTGEEAEQGGDTPEATALARVLRADMWPTDRGDALVTLTLKEVEA